MQNPRESSWFMLSPASDIIVIIIIEATPFYQNTYTISQSKWKTEASWVCLGLDLDLCSASSPIYHYLLKCGKLNITRFEASVNELKWSFICWDYVVTHRHTHKLTTITRVLSRNFCLGGGGAISPACNHKSTQGGKLEGLRKLKNLG